LVMIFLGLASNFFGAKVFKYISGGINAALVFVNSFIIISLLSSSMKPEKAIRILITLVSIVLGLGLAYLAFRISKKNVKHGATMLATFVGLFTGFMIYRNVFQYLWSNIVFMLIIVFGVTCASAFYTHRYCAKIILPLTVILGSYLILRGVSIIIDGGVPTSLSMFGESQNVLGVFYYMMGFGLSILFGVAFQKHHHFDYLNAEEEEFDTDNEEEEEEKKTQHQQ